MICSLSAGLRTQWHRHVLIVLESVCIIIAYFSREDCSRCVIACAVAKPFRKSMLHPLSRADRNERKARSGALCARRKSNLKFSLYRVVGV